LKKNYPGDYKLQKVEALKLWRCKFGQAATYGHLVDTTEKLSGSDIAEDIIELVLESFKGSGTCRGH